MHERSFCKTPLPSIQSKQQGRHQKVPTTVATASPIIPAKNGAGPLQAVNASLSTSDVLDLCQRHCRASTRIVMPASQSQLYQLSHFITVYRESAREGEKGNNLNLLVGDLRQRRL
jgi:hypothetical protein